MTMIGTVWMLYSGEAVKVKCLSMVGGPMGQPMYDMHIMSGPCRGMEIRLTSRELALNGGRQV